MAIKGFKLKQIMVIEKKLISEKGLILILWTSLIMLQKA